MVEEKGLAWWEVGCLKHSMADEKAVWMVREMARRKMASTIDSRVGEESLLVSWAVFQTTVDSGWCPKVRETG
jgi:hypothetical protein